MSLTSLDPIVTDERTPRLRVTRVGEARNDPALRGGRLLSPVEKALSWITNRAGAGIPESANPFARAGAVANTSFLIALVTGILLLFWYKASVNLAHESLENLGFLPQLIRSLHRYSSDAAMLFALFHGVQTLASRKLAGARWLAFLSGLLLIGVLWFDGWTGYWLVWDERARQVALASASLMDALPIFPDPLSRSFLTDGTVNSLLFFIVFFIHMLIPVGFGIFIWVHIMRVNRSKLFTGRTLTVWLGVCLTILSILAPAVSLAPASMATVPGSFTADWWYLGPLTLIERLGAGPIWLIFGVATILLFIAPWLAPKRPVAKTVIDAAKCNGCTQCFQDCPFNAIKLLETDPAGRESEFYAQVDPDRCVGCGICVGSCDSSAIDAPRLSLLDSRRFINAISKAKELDGGPTCVAFVCGASAGTSLRMAPDGSCEALPGYRVVPVSCVGWVHMLTVERALRHGAAGVLIVGCGQDPSCREGCDWTLERLEGKREPFLRRDKVDLSRIRYLRLGSGDATALTAASQQFRTDVLGGATGQAEPNRTDMAEPDAGAATRARRALQGIGVAAVLAGAVWLPSDMKLPRRAVAGSQLVVSFKHAGQHKSGGSMSDDENVLPHMRRPRTTERGRVPVRMRVLVDGEVISEEAYQPGGLFGDGASIAIAEFGIDPGTHLVAVQLADSDSVNVWKYRFEESLQFEPSSRRVVLFESTRGFSAH